MNNSVSNDNEITVKDSNKNYNVIIQDKELKLRNDQKNSFDGIMNSLNDKKWSLILLLGLPGTEKSSLINEITRIKSKDMYILRCSVYGITASIINGCTINHLIGKQNDKLDSPIKTLDYDELYEFSTKVKKEKNGLIIIDEVSTITTRQFYILYRRLEKLWRKTKYLLEE